MSQSLSAHELGRAEPARRKALVRGCALVLCVHVPFSSHPRRRLRVWGSCLETPAHLAAPNGVGCLLGCVRACAPGDGHASQAPEGVSFVCARMCARVLARHVWRCLDSMPLCGIYSRRVIACTLGVC